MNEEAKELRREALTISEVCSACGLGRTKIYEAIAAGSLKAKKAGKRTLVTPGICKNSSPVSPKPELQSQTKDAPGRSRTPPGAFVGFP